MFRVAGIAGLVAGGVLAILAGAGRLAGTAGPASGAAVPIVATPETVVFSTRDTGDPPARMATLRQMLRRNPNEARQAAAYAELALRHYARAGDARFLGYAEGALAPWKSDRDPPPAVWLLRGRILQTQHRFAQSASDMDRFLNAHGASVEATLLAADAWRRAGNIGRARAHCARLAFLGRAELSRYCAADLLLVTGRVHGAQKAVASIEDDLAGLPPATARWMLAVAADVAAASGDDPRAAELYERALAPGDAEISLYVAYADLLLDTGRPADALAILSARPEADAVLLRRAIAARRLRDPRSRGWRRRLAERFALAGQLGGDALHLRERALFELYVVADADTALRLAAENWERQKGREDAELLIAAARAAGRPAAGRPVSDWRAPFHPDAG